MTLFEITMVAALAVIFGVLLFMLSKRQPDTTGDLAELRGQLAQISGQSGALQTLMTEQMAQSEGRLGTRLEQSLRDQNLNLSIALIFHEKQIFQFSTFLQSSSHATQVGYFQLQ
mgnify:CR=1 FL=1